METGLLHHPDAAILGRIDDAFGEVKALALPKQFKAHTDTILAALTDQREYLQSRDHAVCAVGEIGSAKTTTICSLTDMMLPAEALRQRTILLTSAGRTTPCNVTVKPAEQPKLTVEPVSEADLTVNLQWLVSNVVESSKAGDEAVPQEIARCLRGLCGLRGEEAFTKFVKAALEEAPAGDRVGTVVDLLLDRIKVSDRTVSVIEPNGTDWQPWLKTTFQRICDGTLAGVSLPRRIVVEVPLQQDGPFRLAYEDTRGLDSPTARDDIFGAIRDPRACLMFTCGWTSAPGLQIRSLLTRIRDEDPRLLNKVIIVVTHKNDEYENTRDEVTGEYADDREAGYRIKTAQVDRVLAEEGITGVPVVAFDARVDDPVPLREMVSNIIGAMRERVIETAQSSVAAARDLPDAVRRLEGFFEDMRAVLARYQTPEFAPAEAFGETITTIANTHARSVWAMARRNGDYDRLNFYSELAENMSGQARQRVARLVEALREIIQIKLDNPAFAIAHPYLRTILDRVESYHTDFLRGVRMGCQGVYAVPMQSDHAIWGWNSDEYSGFRRHYVVIGLQQYSASDEAMHTKSQQVIIEAFNKRFVNPLRDMARTD